MTPDTLHMTCDTWNVKRDILHGGGEYFLKIQLPSSYGLG